MDSPSALVYPDTLINSAKVCVPSAGGESHGSLEVIRRSLR